MKEFSTDPAGSSKFRRAGVSSLTGSVWRKLSKWLERLLESFNRQTSRANEPQQHVQDLRLSILELSELSFDLPELGQPALSTDRQWNQKLQKFPPRCRHAQSFRTFLGVLLLDHSFFFCHLVLHARPCMHYYATLWKFRIALITKLQLRINLQNKRYMNRHI